MQNIQVSPTRCSCGCQTSSLNKGRCVSCWASRVHELENALQVVSDSCIHADKMIIWAVVKQFIGEHGEKRWN